MKHVPARTMVLAGTQVLLKQKTWQSADAKPNCQSIKLFFKA